MKKDRMTMCVAIAGLGLLAALLTAGAEDLELTAAAVATTWVVRVLGGLTALVGGCVTEVTAQGIAERRKSGLEYAGRVRR